MGTEARIEAAEPRPKTLYAHASGDLPDVNVWLALAVQEHPHHAVASAYWAQAGTRRIWFNRVTMLALVRLLCQPRLMGSAAMNLPQAFSVYRGFAALPEVGLLPEPEACEHELHRLAGAATLPAQLWTDAYLAAFAISTGTRLVSFDRDFKRFGGLDWQRLEAAAPG